MFDAESKVKIHTHPTPPPHLHFTHILFDFLSSLEIDGVDTWQFGNKMIFSIKYLTWVESN